MKKNIILEENKSQLNGKLLNFDIIKNYFVEKKSVNTNGILELIDGKYIIRPSMGYTDDVDIMQSLIGQELRLNTPTYIPVQKNDDKFIIRESLSWDVKSAINSRLYGEKKYVHIGDSYNNTILASDFHNLYIKENYFDLQRVIDGRCSYLQYLKLNKILNKIINKNFDNIEGQRPIDIVFGKYPIKDEKNLLLKEYFTEEGAKKLFKSYMVKLACFSTKNDLHTIMYKTNGKGQVEDVSLLESRVNAIDRLKFIDEEQAKKVKFQTIFSEKPLNTEEVLKNISKNKDLKDLFYKFELSGFYENLANIDVDKVAEQYYDKTSYRFDEGYKEAVKKQIKKVGNEAFMDLFK